jgi:hypothetical protein
MSCRGRARARRASRRHVRGQSSRRSRGRHDCQEQFPPLRHESLTIVQGRLDGPPQCPGWRRVQAFVSGRRRILRRTRAFGPDPAESSVKSLTSGRAMPYSVRDRQQFPAPRAGRRRRGAQVADVRAMHGPDERRMHVPDVVGCRRAALARSRWARSRAGQQARTRDALRVADVTRYHGREPRRTSSRGRSPCSDHDPRRPERARSNVKPAS